MTLSALWRVFPLEEHKLSIFCLDSIEKSPQLCGVVLQLNIMVTAQLEVNTEKQQTHRNGQTQQKNQKYKFMILKMILTTIHSI